MCKNTIYYWLMLKNLLYRKPNIYSSKKTFQIMDKSIQLTGYKMIWWSNRSTKQPILTLYSLKKQLGLVDQRILSKIYSVLVHIKEIIHISHEIPQETWSEYLTLTIGVICFAQSFMLSTTHFKQAFLKTLHTVVDEQIKRNDYPLYCPSNDSLPLYCPQSNHTDTDLI